MLQKILVPLDASELAEKALPYAQHILGDEGELFLLSVIDIAGVTYPLMPGPYPIPIEQGFENNESVRTQITTHAESYLRTIHDRLATSGPEITTLVRAGSPADTIVEAALELGADAIVMSTHGRSGLGRWVYGSVAQKVLSAAPCPVMIIPIGKK